MSPNTVLERRVKLSPVEWRVLVGAQLHVDPPPDLVVEVDITHTDINKNSFYASMGVPEF